MTLKLSKPDRHIHGDIQLDGSKSISNRTLIIRALCGQYFDIRNLANSNDTQLMHQLLSSDEQVLDAGAAGTTFRFLTAYLAFQPGSQTLTGTARMKQRPIGVLVEALRNLGADIEYLENEGFPPLRIHPPKNPGAIDRLRISAATSSQYISALLMLAPTLPNGLILELEGAIVSRPYIEMTLRQMAYFGVEHVWEGPEIRIAKQEYQPRGFDVEADWSAASYYYAIAALSETCDLTLRGLHKNSSQGDSVLPTMMEAFGVETVFLDNAIHLKKSGQAVRPIFEYDFRPCPDLAQTLAVVCAGMGVQGLFTGLETLLIKETDRVAALRKELKKVHTHLSKLPPHFSKKKEGVYYLVDGQAMVEGSPVFETYEDHRMAMAFAPLAMLGEVRIEDPAVVGKSYPAFWEDLRRLGFVVG